MMTEIHNENRKTVTAKTDIGYCTYKYCNHILIWGGKEYN